MKTCTTCKKIKPEEDFYKNKALKDGLFGECKLCHRIRSKGWVERNPGRHKDACRKCRLSNPERTKRVKRAWRQKNKESERQRRVGYRLKRYGLTEEVAKSIIASQGGVCAICGGQPDDKRWGKLNADHNHATGAFRAFLCCRCNIVLGKVGEDPILLEKMGRYIVKHGGKKF